MALHEAVKLSDLKKVKLLLEQGADINANDMNHEPPLWYCNDKTDEGLEILRFLLDRGASMFDERGEFKLLGLLYDGKEKTISELMAKYNLHLTMTTIDPLARPMVFFIAFNKNFDITELLKSQHFDVNARDKRGATVLTQILFNGNVRAAEYLLANGADANAFDEDGFAPLFQVLHSVHNSYYDKEVGLKYIELLLEHGANAQYHYRNRADYTCTIFDSMTYEAFALMMKAILAHLAMTEALGGEVEDIIWNKIKSHTQSWCYFELCKLKITEMKRTTIIPDNDVTLFQCLTTDNIIKLSRKEKLVTNLNSMIRVHSQSEFYYHKVLLKRVKKMMKMINLRRTVGDVLSEIQELQMNAIAIRKIVDYAIYDDLKTIAKFSY